MEMCIEPTTAGDSRSPGTRHDVSVFHGLPIEDADAVTGDSGQETVRAQSRTASADVVVARERLAVPAPTKADERLLMSAAGPVRALNCVLVCHEDVVIRLGLVAALAHSQFKGSVHTCRPNDGELDELLEFANVVVTHYEHGIALCATLRQRVPGKSPTTHVIIVSSRDGEHDIRTAIDAGVKGYLLSGCGLDEFVDGVKTVCQGVRHLCNAAANRVVDSMSREALSARELQVLRCLADGYVNKRICDRLDIALGTVKAHVKSIFLKLGVATRTQAVSLATERGIVAPSNFSSDVVRSGQRAGLLPIGDPHPAHSR